MLKSMTGYGEAELKSTDFKLHIQIKSLNHRFLDPVFNLSEKFLFLEDKLKNILLKYFSRGRINVHINLHIEGARKVTTNKHLAKDYLLQLKTLNKELGLSNGVKFDMILSLPGVIEALDVERQIIDKKYIAKIISVFKKACSNLKQSQQKEGRLIQDYLTKNINLIEREMSLVKNRIKTATTNRLKTLKAEEEKEAFLRDKDITEEINRITMHLKSFRSVFSKNSPVGKELDFILQELQRETNTIGAKSFDSIISKQVVIIKTEIEKLREQVQNVE